MELAAVNEPTANSCFDKKIKAYEAFLQQKEYTKAYLSLRAAEKDCGLGLVQKLELIKRKDAFKALLEKRGFLFNEATGRIAKTQGLIPPSATTITLEIKLLDPSQLISNYQILIEGIAPSKITKLPSKNEFTAEVEESKSYTIIVKEKNKEITRQTVYAKAYPNTKKQDITIRLPKMATTDLPDLEMVRIPAGSFMMGSKEGEGEADERPQHQVNIASFSMGKYEVTQRLWRAVMGSDPEELYFKGCDKCPVEGVSWDDIQIFLKKLNEMTGGKYR
ncbi:MAG TPA: formylglycine-generating enzyme family protein, partial [Phaeodactylibacter sp.]|nr:formylglycine-generating enzyme family protein [Phaeodactylibacter sp.]